MSHYLLKITPMEFIEYDALCKSGRADYAAGKMLGSMKFIEKKEKLELLVDGKPRRAPRR